MDRDKLLKSAEHSLDEASAFYEREGVALSYRPTLEYRNELWKVNPDVLARATGVEDESVLRISEFIQLNLSQVIWRTLHGIEMSDGARPPS